MKEWSDKPSALLKTSSSPATLTGGTSGMQPASSSTASITGTSTVVSTPSGTASPGTGLSRVTAGTLHVVAPLAKGVVVAGVAAVFYGVSNLVKYAKSEKTGVKAARDTMVCSTGLGLSAGLGIATTNAVAGTALALGTAVVVPLAAGVAVTLAGVKAWNKIFFKQNSKPPCKSK